MKRVVPEIRIVNNLSQPLHDAIAKAEPFHQGLEGAQTALTTQLRSRHSVR